MVASAVGFSAREPQPALHTRSSLEKRLHGWSSSGGDWVVKFVVNTNLRVQAGLPPMDFGTRKELRISSPTQRNRVVELWSAISDAE
jgi:hypothetical protein